MMKITVLLLVFLIELAWSRSVPDTQRRCKNENEDCEPGVDCCPYDYDCLSTSAKPNGTCVRAPPNAMCLNQHEKCNIGGRQCCDGFECTELCVDEDPICSSSATRGCADPDFYRKCPRKCDGLCEQRCVSPKPTRAPQKCVKQYEKCSIGGNQCCSGYECIEDCAEENPICFMNNVTRGCADLDFRKKCPRQCGGCERRCITPEPLGAARTCLKEFEGCKMGGDQCCSGYTCIEYCKREDTICSKKDTSWCKYENFRFQCPRKCGECTRCIRENVEV